MREGVTPDWIAFLDESSINSGRYGATSIVLVKAAALDEFNDKLRVAIREVSEFKWNKLGHGQQNRSAERMLDVVFEFAERGLLRIVGLSWDQHDARNAIKDRDDYENFSRMLFHLINNSVRATSGVHYLDLRYDQQDQVDWRKVARSVNFKLAKSDLDPAPEILHLHSVISHDEPGVQVADLFAGLASYSRSRTIGNLEGTSRSEKARAVLIHKIAAWFQGRIPFHFADGRGLVTNRSAPVNLWPYRVIGDYDRAPTKGTRTEPILVPCSVSRCDGAFLDEWGVSDPLCRDHYFERQEQKRIDDEVEAGRQSKSQGSHYCVKCVTIVVVDDSMKRLNANTYEYEYRCKQCKSVLDPLASEANAPLVDPLVEFESRYRATVIQRPQVRFGRQNYAEDN